MVSNLVESNISENKNLSEGLRKLIDQANSYANTAAEIIFNAYKYAIEIDKMTPLQAGDILKKELDYSPRWINEQLPDEAKHLEKKRLPHKSAEPVPQIIEETEPKDVNFTTSTVIKDAVLLEEPEPITPRPDLGEPSKDDWRPPPEQEVPVIIPQKTIDEHREEDKQIIEEVVKPITKKNYRLTLFFAGNDASVIVIGDINKIIPENKYVRYKLVEA